MPLWEWISDLFRFILQRQSKKEVEKDIERKRTLKDRILRYCKERQRQANGNLGFTPENLLGDNVINADEIKDASEVLMELVPNFMVYQDGYYFLKGREPNF